MESICLTLCTKPGRAVCMMLWGVAPWYSISIGRFSESMYFTLSFVSLTASVILALNKEKIHKLSNNVTGAAYIKRGGALMKDKSYPVSIIFQRLRSLDLAWMSTPMTALHSLLFSCSVMLVRRRCRRFHLSASDSGPALGSINLENMDAASQFESWPFTAGLNKISILDKLQCSKRFKIIGRKQLPFI